MSAHLLTEPASQAGLRARFTRLQRRRLAGYDRMGAQLAELHSIQALLAEATTAVGAGWVQHGWFAYRDKLGNQRLAGPHNLQLVTGRPVTGACLVGAIVLAGGGMSAARSQSVHRALDLTWHALFRAETAPVSFCPASALRVAQVRDLTCWNDRPYRRVRDVTTLLQSAGRVAGAEMQRVTLALAAD